MAGTPPDVYRYLQEVTPIVAVAEKKLHLELDPFIAKDKYDVSDFRPSALALYQWDGKTYALPRDYGHRQSRHDDQQPVISESVSDDQRV